MPYTNYPNELTSGGVPLIGGVNGIPLTGNWFFVNETTGNDGLPGTAQQPLATLSRALSLATANQNDVIAIQGTVHTTASIAWNKNQVHLVGMDAPLQRGKRARISVTGTTAFDKLFNVTASGCWFSNFGTFYGFNDASANICWYDAGGRNCYDLVEFLGFGDGTVTTGTANHTAARAFTLTGNTGETTFRRCTFGVDTVTRNAANYTMEIAGDAPRVTLEDCVFEAFLGASGGASSHLLVGAAGIDRYVDLVRCRFHAAGNSGATTMAQCLNVSASAGGTVWLDQCTIGPGVTAWQTTPTANVVMNMTAPSAGGGKAIQNA